MNFLCPDCGGERIEEIMTDVVVASEVRSIHSSGEVEYGEQINSGGTIDRYQCQGCGWTLPDAIESYAAHDSEFGVFDQTDKPT